MATTRKIARIVIAFAIAITYIVLVIPYIQNVQNASNDVSKEISELTKPPRPYSFQIPLYLRFNGTNPIGLINESGIAFALNFTYPNGTLIANEPVTINSTALIDYAYSTLDHVVIFFQNSLAYPFSYEDNGIIPKQGSLAFPNPLNIEGTNIVVRNVTVISNAQITWPIEGDYTPIIGVFFRDGTNKTYTTNDVVIHVYPQEQLTQIETNRISLENNQASLELSKAVVILSTIAIVAFVVQIVDRTDNQCKNPQDQANNKYRCPYIEDKRRNRFEIIKQKNKADKAKSQSTNQEP